MANLQSPLDIKKFIFYLFLCFWPILFFTIPFMLFNLSFLTSTYSSYSSTAEMFSGLIIQLGIPLAIIIALSVSYKFVKNASSWLTRGLLIYVAWITTAVIISFLFLIFVGGASMAVAEGAVSREMFYEQALLEIPFFILILHVFIVPWVLISTLIMRRFSRWFF